MIENSAPRPLQAATPPAKRAPRPSEPRAIAKSEEPAPQPATPQAEVAVAAPSMPAPAPTPAPAAPPSGPEQAAVVDAPARQAEPAPLPTSPVAEKSHDEAAPSVSSAAEPAQSPAPLNDAPPTPAPRVSAAVPAKVSGKRGFLVQVGAFHDPQRAHRLCSELAAKGYDLTVSAAQGEASRDWFYCRSTAAADRADATAAAQRLHEAENAPVLVVPATATN